MAKPFSLPPSGPPAPFVLGAGRSGTTMLRLMLDSHSRLAIPPETGFAEEIERRMSDGTPLADAALGAISDCHNGASFGLSRIDLAQAFADLPPGDRSGGGVGLALRAFYRLYAARRGKPRWGDKTPIHTGHVARLARHLPEARFIHLIRDGRDVAASIRDLWFAPSRDPAALARWWRETIETARRQASGLPPGRYFEVRYEDLVSHPRRELERICAWIELPFEAGMLEFHTRAAERLAELRTVQEPDGRLVIEEEERRRIHALTLEPPALERIGRFRRLLAEREIAAFEAEAGDFLETLGYPLEAVDRPTAPVRPQSSLSEAV